MDNSKSFNAMLWQIPGLVTLKDTTSVYQGVSAQAAEFIFGAKTDEHILGCLDADIPCKAAEFADIFVAQDQKTLVSGSLTTLEFNGWADGKIKTLLAQKKSYRNKHNHIIGTMCFAFELTKSLLTQINHTFMLNSEGFRHYSGKQQHSYIIGGLYQEKKLTKKESECLFYLLRKKTMKEIAGIINRSPRTIEMHIGNLKAKFNCQTTPALIASAIEQGFIYSIPHFLLPFPVSLELK